MNIRLNTIINKPPTNIRGGNVQHRVNKSTLEVKATDRQKAIAERFNGLLPGINIIKQAGIQTGMFTNLERIAGTYKLTGNMAPLKKEALLPEQTEALFWVTADLLHNHRTSVNDAQGLFNILKESLLPELEKLYKGSKQGRRGLVAVHLRHTVSPIEEFFQRSLNEIQPNHKELERVQGIVDNLNNLFN